MGGTVEGWWCFCQKGRGVWLLGVGWCGGAWVIQETGWEIVSCGSFFVDYRSCMDGGQMGAGSLTSQGVLAKGPEKC